jgi:secreted PhoX family phosphatase
VNLAPAFKQSVLNSEPSFPDRAAGLALNKADPDSERYLFRTHSLASNAAVSVTDLANANATRILSQRADWERLDGIVFTPSKSLLVGENVRVAEKKDPGGDAANPEKGGLVYEINMTTGVPTVRPALGAKAHKGMSFDHLGNLYSVSATNPGYVYRFVPTVAGNYSAGVLSALWAGPNGESQWLFLNQTLVRTDADEAARQAGATAFSDPEDAEVLIITSPTGAKRSQLFVAETGANRVITVVLRGSDNTAFSSVYVAPGVNAPKDFAAPSDIAIDVTYSLWISERNGGGAVETSKTAGDDIWVAPANPSSAIQALPIGRVASLTDCDAEPAGLHFDLTTSKLFLDLKHRGGDGRDMTMLITSSGGL